MSKAVNTVEQSDEEVDDYEDEEGKEFVIVDTEAEVQNI